MVSNIIISLGSLLKVDFNRALQKMQELKSHAAAVTVSSTAPKVDMAQMLAQFQQHLAFPYNQGKLTTEQFVAQSKQALGLSGISDKQFQEIWNAMIVIEEDTVNKILARLASLSGHNVILISDTNPLHMQFIREKLAETLQSLSVATTYELKCSKAELIERTISERKLDKDDTVLVVTTHEGIQAPVLKGAQQQKTDETTAKADALGIRCVSWDMQADLQTVITASAKQPQLGL